MSLGWCGVLVTTVHNVGTKVPYLTLFYVKINGTTRRKTTMVVCVVYLPRASRRPATTSSLLSPTMLRAASLRHGCTWADATNPPPRIPCMGVGRGRCGGV